MAKWPTKKRPASLVWMAGLATVWMLAAVAPGKAAPKTPPAQAAPAQAARPTFTVGKPISHGNLTVFPVYGREQPKIGSQYLTLDDALKQKLIQVKEMTDEEVSRVSVTNKGSKMIYLMAGDLILGGAQDRIISRDTIVPQGARNFIVEVFCVEHGRWDGGQVSISRVVRLPAAVCVAKRSKLNSKAKCGKVAQETAKTKSQTRSGTYRAVATNKATQQQITSYTQTLNTQLAKDKRALGLVVAINGRVTVADVFADSHLFHKQLSKILKSYALDAV